MDQKLEWLSQEEGRIVFLEKDCGRVRVTGGVETGVEVFRAEFTAIVGKRDTSRIEEAIELPESVEAPIRAGQQVGQVIYRLDGQELGRSPICAKDAVDEIGFWDIFVRMIHTIAFCS